MIGSDEAADRTPRGSRRADGANPDGTLRRAAAGLPWLALGLVVVQLSRWAGVPGDNRFVFWLGVGIMTAVALALALLGRLLLVAPRRSADRSDAAHLEGNRLLAGLLLVAGLAVAVGGFWDEVWHRRYGLPFGRDLLWRPHLLMYFGFAAVIASAASVFALALRGSGSLRLRLAAHPARALLMLLGAFLLYSLPADPLWHVVYGADISAWSLPHLLLAVNFGAVTVVAVALLAGASGPTPARRGAWWSDARALFVVVALALSLNLLLQVFTTEWDGLRRIPAVPLDPFWHRPEWLLPAVIGAIAALIGVAANRATGRIGAATLAGVTALAFRWTMLQLFEYERMSTDIWLLTIPPLLALDIASLLLARAGTLSWWGSALAVATGTALGTLPLLPLLLVYPRVDATTLVPMLLTLSLAALGAAWYAGRLGTWLAARFDTARAGEAVASGRRWLLPGILVAALTAIALFIVTAPAPV